MTRRLADAGPAFDEIHRTHVPAREPPATRSCRASAWSRGTQRHIEPGRLPVVIPADPRRFGGQPTPFPLALLVELRA